MLPVIVVIDSVPRYTLSIHSSKALLVEQKMLHATALADAVIQLAIVKGERHEVTVVNLSLDCQIKPEPVWHDRKYCGFCDCLITYKNDPLPGWYEMQIP